MININKPLNMNEILQIINERWSNMRKDMKTIFLLMFLPVAMLQSLVFLSWERDVDNFFLLLYNDISTNSQMYLDTYTSLAINNFLMFLIPTFLGVVGSVATIIVVYTYLSSEVNGVEIDFGEVGLEAIKKAFLIYSSIVFMEMWYFFIVGMATMFFVLPAVYLSFIWLFYMQARVIRKKKIREAFQYSNELVKKNFRICGIVFIVTNSVNICVSWIFGAFVTIIGDLFSAVAVQFLIYLAVGGVTIFTQMVYTILFLNLECTTFKMTLQD